MATSRFFEGNQGADDALKAGFVTLGAELYGPDWDDKKEEFIRYMANGNRGSDGRLTESQYQRLINGMRRKMETLPKLIGDG